MDCCRRPCGLGGQVSETTHEVSHYPQERFFYFLEMWDVEWTNQKMRGDIELIAARLMHESGLVEAYQ